MTFEPFHNRLPFYEWLLYFVCVYAILSHWYMYLLTWLLYHVYHWTSVCKRCAVWIRFQHACVLRNRNPCTMSCIDKPSACLLWKPVYIHYSVCRICCKVGMLSLNLYSIMRLYISTCIVNSVLMQCVGFHSQRTFFKQLREDRLKIAAIGSGCTLATEPSAELSTFFNIPQVKHWVLCTLIFWDKGDSAGIQQK